MPQRVLLFGVLETATYAYGLLIKTDESILT